MFSLFNVVMANSMARSDRVKAHKYGEISYILAASAVVAQIILVIVVVVLLPPAADANYAYEDHHILGLQIRD